MLLEDRAGVSRAGKDRRVGRVGRWPDMEAASARIRAAAGTDVALALAQPDAAGRLRVAWTDPPIPSMARTRAARRRAAFDGREPVGPTPAGDGFALCAYPLLAQDRPVGVLEVFGRARALLAAHDDILAVADGLARALAGEVGGDRAGAPDDDPDAPRHLTALAEARSPAAAVDAAVRTLSARLDVPVAGWCVDQDDTLALTSLAGVSGAAGVDVRRALDGLEPWSGTEARRVAEARFAEATGIADAMWADAGDAVLLAGDANPHVAASIELVSAVLADVLPLLRSARAAQRRSDELDLGIAWTAHELRGPLLGVRAVLELVQRRGDADPRQRAVVQSSLRELDHIVGTTEGLLAWAVGAQPLERTETEVVQLAQDAIDACRLETGHPYFRLSGSERAVAYVDAAHVRSALLNLLRNAVAYADHATEIEVGVGLRGAFVSIEVSDVGPAIPPEERESIFDPFVRGTVSGRARNGSGLGLFIVRRVVEAHEGRLWVESNHGATTFHVLLPAAGKGAARCAS
ncbi:MAG: sensor histidine kinase [Planctomycetaceae bacterium]